MKVARTSLVGSLVVAFVAAGAMTTSTACRTCYDIAIKRTDCFQAFGTFDEEECTCVGARPPTYLPPTTSPKPTGSACRSDDECASGTHCRDTGRCTGYSCDRDDCRCTTTARHCITTCDDDLDCRAEARCRIHLGGDGICLRSCTLAADCPTGFRCSQEVCEPTSPAQACGPGDTCPDGLSCMDGGCVSDLASCEVDADCRTSEGAICKEGRCYDAGLRDAGVDGG